MVSYTLSEYIQRFPDHRTHGVRYRFGSMVLLVIVGYLCGRDSLIGVWRFAQTLSKPQRKRLGFRDGKLPTHPALCNAFHEANAEALCVYLSHFVLRDHPEQALHLAIDGKRLRGSKHGDHPGVHVISAFCKEVQAVVGSVEMGCTNEIGAALDLLEKLELKGNIITGDAIFTQQELCRKITHKGGDYLFPVKDNQKPLRRAIRQTMETADKKTADG